MAGLEGQSSRGWPLVEEDGTGVGAPAEVQKTGDRSPETTMKESSALSPRGYEGGMVMAPRHSFPLGALLPAGVAEHGSGWRQQSMQVAAPNRAPANSFSSSPVATIRDKSDGVALETTADAFESEHGKKDAEGSVSGRTWEVVVQFWVVGSERFCHFAARPRVREIRLGFFLCLPLEPPFCSLTLL